MRAPLLAALMVLALASPAAAQGNGRGKALGRFKSAPVAAPSSGGGAAQQQQQQQAASQAVGTQQPLTGTGIRNFGAWLDDASLLPAGMSSVSLSFGWFRSPAFHEFDMPVIDGGIGLTRRVQVGFSVPYYHFNEPGGPVARGLGDLYLSTKIQLRDPAAHDSGVGFSITPVLEMLSTDPGPEGSRLDWALPASITPGRSLSPNTMGRSKAPAQSTACLATICQRRWRGSCSGGTGKWSLTRSTAP